MKVLLAATLALAAVFAPAQGTQADYDRANNFGRGFAGKVRNERLTSGWLSNGRLWFREDLSAGQREFLQIDPKSGRRTPLFDHVRLAKSLSDHLKQAVEPKKLPFDRIVDSPDGTKFRVDTSPTALTVDWKTYAIAKDAGGSFGSLPAFSPADVTASEGAGERTEITFVNRSAVKLQAFWLDDGGQRRHYKTLDPGETWSIQTYEGHFWLVARMDGKALAVYKPSKDQVAYLSDVEVPTQARPTPRPGVSPDGEHQIVFRERNAVLLKLKTNESMPLTTDGTVNDAYQGPVRWSPDGKTVTFYQTEPEESRPLNIVQTTPRNQFQPRLETRQYLKPGDRVAKPQLCFLRLGGAVQKVPMDLYPNPWDLDGEQWLDNDRLAFRYNQRGHQAMRLLELNARTGAVRTLINEETTTFIDWTRKSFYEISPDKREAIWMSERSGWCHLYLYDLARGELKNTITTGEWVLRNVERVDWDKRQILFRASGMYANQDPYHMHLGRVGLNGRGLTWLTDGDGTHRHEFSPDGQYLLATYSRVDLPPVHELRRVSDGKSIAELVRADATELLAFGFRMPIRFTAKGRDGKTDIWGIIHPPAKTDALTPIVEDIYAGPHDAHVPKAWHTNSGSFRLAELGFAVVRIDGMGTSARSKAFHDVCWKNIADAGFPDRRLWIQAAAGKYPWLDLKRIGIVGTSAGGQNTLHALLLHGDFYKVGVADCGCYDNRMDKIWWNEQWMGYPVGPHYEAQSGRTLAKNLTGQLMLMVGENDTNVDPASTYQVVDALVAANKDFELVVLPNVGHGAVGHPYGRRKQYDFLVRHLFGVVPRR